LHKKIEKALNAQINAEFWSAYLYLSMSVHFDANGKPGFAKWFRSQFHEEQGHATKIIDYVISRGGKVELAPIEKVETSWESPLAAFEDTLKHEKIVTGYVNKLVALSREENDYATESFLKWFIDEQVEEESTASAIVDAVKSIDGNGLGLFLLDKELGGRK
jgi:ferritin